jgi:hypothetical protein
MDADGLAPLVTRAAQNDYQLMADLLAFCWPGGPADRTSPVAREWLHRWTAKPTLAGAPLCRCSGERCACRN